MDRYPELANVTAMVAFHQDGPLRALQMPQVCQQRGGTGSALRSRPIGPLAHPLPSRRQVYAKAGMRYLKASRYGDGLFRWQSPDGSSLLAYEEYHYGEGPDDVGYNVSLSIDTVTARMQDL